MQINLDMGELTSALGVVWDTNDALSDKRFLGKVNGAVQEAVVDAFYRYADSMARANPHALHHVYEWDRVGEATEDARLFRVLRTGSSGTVNRVAYDFKVSSDPRPPYAWERQTHVFYYKAWVFEQGGSTGFGPKNAQVLAIPTEDGLFFTNYTEYEFSTRTRGRFADLWENYWRNVAQREVALRGTGPAGEAIKHHLLTEIRSGGFKGKSIVGGAGGGATGFLPARTVGSTTMPGNWRIPRKALGAGKRRLMNRVLGAIQKNA